MKIRKYTDIDTQQAAVWKCTKYRLLGNSTSLSTSPSSSSDDTPRLCGEKAFPNVL